MFRKINKPALPVFFTVFIPVMVFLLLPFVKVNAEDATPIYTTEDLLKIAENPGGRYILMCDLDMTDVDWKPVDFTGVFEGNHHAIMNLTIDETSDAVRTTYDGNYKVYDTHFAGLFGALEDAEVKNLSLLGITAEVDEDEPCFVGAVAGFAERSKIEGCTVKGILRLDVSTTMFGVGGIVGYGGDGAITRTEADVTLICIDHDKENRDEQFMGGAYSAGYLDVDECTVKIDGYDSDHGYVHNGGLVGMYILYPRGTEYAGYINNTRVEGMITFFEDNTDRRAYCKDFIGEVMNWTYEYAGNSSDFTRNEIMDYSKDLLPHYCDNPKYHKNVIEPGPEEYGCTVYFCTGCGEYTYTADYTAKFHNVKDFTVIEDATYEKEGLAGGICQDCSETVYEIIPVKEKPSEIEMPEETESVTITDVENPGEGTEVKSEVTPQEEKNTAYNKRVIFFTAAVVFVLLVAFGLFFIFRRGRQFSDRKQ